MEKFNPIVLRRFRYASHRKIPLRELAGVIGCSVGTYGKKERGLINVSINDLTKLAVFYKVSVANFFGDPSLGHISRLLKKGGRETYTENGSKQGNDKTKTLRPPSLPVNDIEEIHLLREQVIYMSRLMTQFRKRAMELEREKHRLRSDLEAALKIARDCKNFKKGNSCSP